MDSLAEGLVLWDACTLLYTSHLTNGCSILCNLENLHAVLQRFDSFHSRLFVILMLKFDSPVDYQDV